MRATASTSSGQTPVRFTAFALRSHAAASPLSFSATGMVRLSLAVAPAASVTVRVAVSSEKLPVFLVVTVTDSAALSRRASSSPS